MIIAYLFSYCVDEQQIEDNQNTDPASVRAHNGDTMSEWAMKADYSIRQPFL